MKNKLTRNWGLKIASFLSAAVLWLVVTNINDPISTYRVTDVPVTIKNANLITERGQVYEVLDGTDMIDVVTISAPRSIIDSLDKSNIVAVADVNDLTSVDTVAIKLSTNNTATNWTAYAATSTVCALALRKNGTDPFR